MFCKTPFTLVCMHTVKHVYKCTHTHTHTHAQTHTHTHAHIHTHTYTHTHTHTLTYTHACRHTHAHTRHTQIEHVLFSSPGSVEQYLCVPRRTTRCQTDLIKTKPMACKWRVNG